MQHAAATAATEWFSQRIMRPTADSASDKYNNNNMRWITSKISHACCPALSHKMNNFRVAENAEFAFLIKSWDK